MDGFGEHLFSRTALSSDQYGGVAFGRNHSLLFGPFYFVAVADNIVQSVFQCSGIDIINQFY